MGQLVRYAVEKHVRAMMNKRAEEQMEQVRLGQRADKLRLEGEAQLQAIICARLAVIRWGAKLGTESVTNAGSFGPATRRVRPR